MCFFGCWSGIDVESAPFKDVSKLSVVGEGISRGTGYISDKREKGQAS